MDTLTILVTTVDMKWLIDISIPPYHVLHEWYGKDSHSYWHLYFLKLETNHVRINQVFESTDEDTGGLW